MKLYQRVMLIVIVTIVVMIAAQIGVALAVMGSGWYNVGADHPHGQVIQWYFSKTMERSVQKHAQGLKAPAQVSIAHGASEYAHMCVFCHAAPGVERSVVGDGLSPFPPALTQTANDWTIEQIFWIAKHGIGDTGMPAFGPTHEDPELWAVAHFVKQLPNLTPADYKKLVAEGASPEPSGERSGSQGSPE